MEQSGHACHVFDARKGDLRDFGENVVKGERYAPQPVEAMAMRRWLRKLPTPVAVFCSHDLRAHQVLTICREAGISVPHEAAILGVDDDAILCSFMAPTLSSIDPNGFEAGRAAVRIAREMLQSAEARRNPPQVFVKPLRLNARESTEVYPVEPPWLAEALAYINRNARRGASASDVFRHVGLSHTAVGIAFRRKMGVSVQKLLARTRLAEAGRLVECGSSVTDAARKAGFSSVQYFCRAFAAEHGMPPAAWQAASRGNS